MSNTRVRLIDVAKRAEVSRAAVARVLLGTGKDSIRVSEAKSALIRKHAKEMNFQVDKSAQMLAGKSSKIIGVLIDSYAPQVKFKTLSVVEEILARKGYRLIIGQTHDNFENFKSYIADFASRRVDAIICFAHEYPDFDVSKEFHGFDNVVFVGRPKQLKNTSFVEVDIKKGMQKIVKHLCAAGRKKIALFYPGTDASSVKQRMDGYKIELQAQGIAFDDELVYSCLNNLPFKDNYLEAIKYLVGERKVDAIIANNDIWAVNLIKYLKKNDIYVPRDVAVVGVDDLDVAQMIDPELTTVNQKSTEQGDAISQIILEMIENKQINIPRQITIEPELIIREST